MNRLAAVHLKPYLAFENYRVVDRVRPMHPGILALEGVAQPGKALGVFLDRRRKIQCVILRNAVGRIRDNVKRRAAWPGALAARALASAGRSGRP